MYSIEELTETFKLVDEDTKKFIDKQHTLITQLLLQIKHNEEEISHLKELVASTIPLIGDNKTEIIIVTPEEALCDKQISYLTEKSIARELTLEETKKLDLLLKNKNLMKEQKKDLDGSVKKLDRKNITKAELVKLATVKSNE